MRLTTISPEATVTLTEDEVQALGVRPGEQVVIEVKNGIVTIVPLVYLDAPDPKK